LGIRAGLDYLEDRKFLVSLAGTEEWYLSDPGIVTDMFQQFPKHINYNE